MKQTVGILSALIVALLVLSAFILSTNLQQGRLLSQSSDALTRMQAEKEELLLAHQTLESKNNKLNASLKTVTAERDALSLQLNDAVLASQEANDAVSLQADQAQELQQRIDLLTQRNQELEAALANVSVSPAPAPAVFPFSTFSPLFTPPPQ